MGLKMGLNDLMPDIDTLIPYGYSAIQTPDYERLLEWYLAKAKISDRPHFVQIGGIPGAGKSTFCANRRWTDKLFISFDAIMENIPEYRADVGKLGKVESFKKWELPARVIGYELLRRAVDVKADIFLEHSGVNRPHVQLVNRLKKFGYQTEMHFIMCRLDIACARAAEREKKTSRHTPPSLITERSNLVNDYLETYSALVDNLYVYDTTENTFLLRRSYQSGNLVNAA